METTNLAMADEATPPPQILGFQELYEQHSEAVYYAALRVTGNPADAEDVLQTVFMRLLDRDQGLDAANAPGAYLRRAAVNTSIDVLRRKKSRREKDIEEIHDPHQRLHLVPDGEEDETFFLKERLRTALTGLPRENAELLVLHYLEGYSYDELAGLLHVERGTIGSRLHRIRAALKKDLKD